MSQPLDSGLRRNDDKGWGQAFGRNGKRVVGIAINPFLPPPSFQRRLESRRAGRGGERVAGFIG